MQTHPTTADLLAFIAASPTPYHCAAEAERRLHAAGFTTLRERDAWKLEAGGGYCVVRGGALVAFRVGARPAAEAGLRLIGAHTDSPNLRVKPAPDVVKEGYRQLAVEVYGGALTHTWLDRDLGLAGQVVLKAGRGVESKLLHIARPILRIPSLAIHLNRNVREEGLKLNDQQHLVPILGLDTSELSGLAKLLAGELGVEPDRIVAWDLSLFDAVPPAIGGALGEFIFSPRLDNQGMSHAALSALLRSSPKGDATALICLYDHEEVGSESLSGAGGSLAADVLHRIVELEGPWAQPGALPRAMASSWHVSADMAHAIHPNYADKHEPNHAPRLNGGPVLKVNHQQRYATTAEGAGLFESLCREADVPVQRFVSRGDLPCGSTIGPIAAARLGVRTIDVGNPMLSMHSCREQAGAHDPERMVEVLSRFLSF